MKANGEPDDDIRDLFLPFIGEIVTLQMHGETSDHRISGRVETIGPQFLCLRHKDQRCSLVAMSSIAVISIVPDRRRTGNIEKLTKA
ncbi:MAG: hypothetical protein ABR985_22835 [Methanotrichaceae archaeon]|jgi:hypothetical protein